jgi:serine/threonine-protein kinase
MGEVYLAEDRRLERKVALKILPPAFAQDAGRMRRFVQEAKAASALNHPNILTIYEVGEFEKKNYIASEYVEGETLSERLRREPLNLKAALDVAVQITSALQAAHSVGIVHRDIKPDNVMIRPDGVAKLLDFGIAKLTQEKTGLIDAEAATAIKASTSPGMIIGTAAYMSPEQARGNTVDGRSDIFSFGLVLYEMLTGTRAFAGENAMDVISSILQKEPAPLSRLIPDLPREIERIVGKALRKDCEERYQTAKDLLIDLKDVRQELEFQNKLGRTADPPRQQAETEIINAAATDAVQPNSSAQHLAAKIKNHKLATAATLLVLTLGVAALYYFTRGNVSNKQTSGEAITSLAVLPLKSLDAGENYLGLGIADTVIRRISQTGKLIVRPTSAVRRYLNEDTDALTAARQLNADAVLEGSVQRAGDLLRVSVNLLRTSDGASLWADKFDMRMTDIFAIQDKVAQQVASRLQLQLDPSQQAQLTKRSTSNPTAYEFYQKGVYTFDQRVSFAKPQWEATINFFKQAIEADPNFALAHAQLAYTYATTAVFFEPTEPVWAERAKEEINQAQTLDPQLAETHLARFQLLYSVYEGYQGEAAIREVLLAQQLNPNVGHGELAYLYLHLGLEDLGARELQRAFEIDPTSEFAKAMTLLLYEVGGKYDEYAAHRELYHDDEMEVLYFMSKGRLDEAQKAIEEWSAKTPGRINLPPRRALLSALKGDFRAAEGAIPVILSRHPVKDPTYHHAAYDIARIYALEGKNVEAVKWLREANATGFQPYPLFERDAYLNRIRQAPEFIQLMAVMKAQNERYKREFAQTP